MDTSPLEEKIKAIEAEIADDHQRIDDLKKEVANKIDLIKENITTNKQALKVYKKGLERIKGQEK